MPYIECHHCNKIIHNVSILKDITLNLDRNKIYGIYRAQWLWENHAV